MDEGFRRQAQDWFDRGDHDIQTAELLYDQRGHTDAIAYPIQQAITLHLPFVDLCEKATKYYMEDRYPLGPPPEYSREEIRADLELTWELVREIRQKAG